MPAYKAALLKKPVREGVSRFSGRTVATGHDGLPLWYSRQKAEIEAKKAAKSKTQNS